MQLLAVATTVCADICLKKKYKKRISNMVNIVGIQKDKLKSGCMATLLLTRHIMRPN